jgi:hypothetical protein
VIFAKKIKVRNVKKNKKTNNAKKRDYFTKWVREKQINQ